MATLANLVVKITADAGQLTGALSKAENRVSGFNNKLKSMRAPLLALGGAMTGVGILSIKAASDLEQSIGAVDAVFQGAADTIHDFGQTAAKEVALSRRAFNESVVPLGAMMKNAGVEINDVADRMIDLTKIAADMAATHSGTVAEALDALGAAFRGEADPIERYGLTLNASRINAKAMALGLEDATGAINGTSRAAAFMDLVMEQTVDIQGQFGREVDSSAQRAQRLTARIEDLNSSIGTKLLPHWEKMLGWVEKGVIWFDKLPKPVKDGIVAVSGIVGALALLGLVLSPLITVGSAVVAVIGAIGATAGIIIAVVAVIAAVIAGLVALYLKNEEFRDRVNAAWEMIRETAGAVWTWIQNTVQDAISGIRNWWEENGEAITESTAKLWDQVKDLFGAAMKVIGGIITVAVAGWTVLWEKFGGVITGAMEIAWDLVKDIIKVAGDFIGDLFTGMAQSFSGFIDIIVGLIDGDWARVWDGAKLMLTGFGNTAIAVANGVIGAFEAMVNAIATAVNGIPEINLPSIVGGGSISLPNIPEANLPRIPMLAEGGIVTRPTLAMIGEAGPEAVIPLNRGNAGGGNTTINVTINGNVDSPARAEQFAAELSRRLRNENRRGISVGAMG